MKVAFVLSSISRANGGISESVRRLAQSLRATGSANIAVASLRDAHTDADLPLWLPLTPRCAAVRGPRALGFAPGLAAALQDADADVTHAAGLWMYPSLANRTWARRARRPYLISPHGMLDAWALRNSAWKKQLAGRLFERAHLEGAACLHALCDAEAASIRACGLKNPICILPNGVDLPAAPHPATPPAWAERLPAGRRVLLFLGRIHPKKGLLNLLQAWTRLPAPPDWQLVVAGWDQGGHQQELEQFAATHGLRDQITFVGPLHGAAKSAAYAHAHGFILPSFSEGLPMTVLEAWAHGLPVLMTAACNLPEGFAEGAAIEISTDPDIMARSLLQFFSAVEHERAALGLNGRSLAQNKFDWTRIAGEMLSVYRWVTGAEPRPACVHI